MPGRSFTPPNKYKFGFQGQENENDISGVDGGHLFFRYRIHDARLGRFLSVDPLSKSYPWNSTYAFAENRVIDGIDLEGLEYTRYESIMDKKRAELALSGARDIAFGVGAVSGGVYYSTQTGGVGYVLGGGVAITLGVGEIGLGAAKIGVAFNGDIFNHPGIVNNGSLFGITAYGFGASPKTQSRFDAAGQFIPGMVSGGNFKGLIDGGVGLFRSVKTLDVASTLKNGMDAWDASLDIGGLTEFLPEYPGDPSPSAPSVNSAESPFKQTEVSVGSSSGLTSTNTSYTIQSGDNLYSLANKFNTTVSAIASQNNIADVDYIQAGATINVTTNSTDAE